MHMHKLYIAYNSTLFDTPWGTAALGNKLFPFGIKFTICKLDR
jgi:hypothetical protein